VVSIMMAGEFDLESVFRILVHFGTYLYSALEVKVFSQAGKVQLSELTDESDDSGSEDLGWVSIGDFEVYQASW
jgi:hypothetical protein